MNSRAKSGTPTACMRVRVRVLLSSVSVSTICKPKPRTVCACNMSAFSPAITLSRTSAHTDTHRFFRFSLCLLTTHPIMYVLVGPRCQEQVRDMSVSTPARPHGACHANLRSKQCVSPSGTSSRRAPRATNKHTSTQARAETHRILPVADCCSSFQQHIYDIRVSVDASHHETCTV